MVVVVVVVVGQVVVVIVVVVVVVVVVAVKKQSIFRFGCVHDFQMWKTGNEDIYHFCFKGFIGRMLSNKIFNNSHKWSECHKGKMEITG